MEDQTLRADAYFGCSDVLTIKFDLDEMEFNDVLYWGKLALKKFDLKGLITFESSEKSHHLVFDSYAESYEENMSIVAWVARLSNKLDAMNYLSMQNVKRSSTLRVLPKENKPAPRIVYRSG